ncbi:MAG: lysine--tRNA ligase [Pseudomonadota bacterium]
MSQQPIFWADQVASEILAARTKFVAATGITPSGEIHIGNLREVVTGDAVTRVLREMGKEPTFFYIADTFDPLRRVYPFLDPVKYTPYIGQPLSRIPAPKEGHSSYAEHFLAPFMDSLKTLDIGVQVVRANEMYEQGRYNQQIIRSLERADKIRAILKEETGKETDETWSPFNPICNACKRMTATTVVGFDAKREQVEYRCECGDHDSVPMAGGGKLTWRVDWAARWQILGVTIEPFGKDHASKGGSYDTGVRISREVFEYEPPFPVVYEWISLRGGGDMSSSKGNVLSIHEMLEVVPPEILKYCILRVIPNRRIVFDPGLPLTQLIDEYDDPTSSGRNDRAAKLSEVPGTSALGAPFRHIVSLVQTTNDQVNEIGKILERTGYLVSSPQLLAERVRYARKWLDRFAPEEIRFSIQKEIPNACAALSTEQKKALRFLSERLASGMTAEQIHQTVYGVKDEVKVAPDKLFEAIYLSLLGKPKGPRAGFFLASLDMTFVKNRFAQVAAN